MMAMFQYFFYTVLMELPITTIAYSKEWQRMLLIGFLLNLFSWPLLTLLYFRTDIHLLLLELGVVCVEAIGFRIFFTGTFLKAFLVSLLANCVSLTVGVLLNGISII